MKELLTVIDCSKTEGSDISEILQKKLLEIWEWAQQRSCEVRQSGLGAMEKELGDKMLDLELGVRGTIFSPGVREATRYVGTLEGS